MEFFNIVIYAIPGLALLVVIHELGHLLFARWTGIGVEAFSIFFGRPIYSFKWKNIDWRIGWIPFGGYCKMKGQEDFIKAEKLKGEPDEFYSRPTWARLLTVLGGPVFNIILGLILVTFIFYFGGETILFNGPINIKPKYKELSSLQNGDIILAVDGKPVTQDIGGKTVSTLNMVRKYIVVDGMGNDEYNLTVMRRGVNEPFNIVYPFHEDLIKGGELGFVVSGDFAPAGSSSYNAPYSIFKDGATISIGAFSGEDAPAKKAGLKKGDAILAIDGKKIRHISDVSKFLNGVSNNIAHTFLVFRGGSTKEVSNIKPNVQLLLSKISESDEVYKRGLRNNDVLFTVDNKEIISANALLDIVAKSDGKKNFKLGIIRGGTKMELYANSMVLQQLIIKQRRVVGIHLINGVHQYYSIFSSIPRGIDKTWTFMKLTILQFTVLPKMEFDTVKDNVAGPIGIFKKLGESAASGFGAYMNFVAILSILLGVFNLLPIPAVDGGHVVLTLYEMIKRKPLSMKTIQRFQLVGVFIIISLAILITINDILKLVVE